MKVYELAKKLEVKSVFLMDKIRKEWKLPVKTHMETLTPDLVKKIEEKFYDTQKLSVKKTSKKKKTTAKKSTIKKVSAVKKATAKTTSAVQKKTSVTKKPVLEKQQIKTIIKSSSLTEEKSKKQETSPQVKRKFIIRRKTDEKQITESSPSTKTQSSSPEKKDIPSPATQSGLSKSIRLDLVSVKTTNPLDEGFWANKTEEPAEPIKKQPKKPIAEKRCLF